MGFLKGSRDSQNNSGFEYSAFLPFDPKLHKNIYSEKSFFRDLGTQPSLFSLFLDVLMSIPK